MIEIVLTLEGVMCPHCEARVNTAVSSAVKVKRVTTSHKSGECSVICSEDTDRDALISAIEEQGYKVIGTIEKSYRKKGIFSALFGKK